MASVHSCQLLASLYSCIKLTRTNNKTLQECETALTSQYKTLFLVFVFCLLSFVFGLFVFLSFCLLVYFVSLSGHHSDHMAEESEVSKVTLYVEILKWRSPSD